MIKGNFLNNHCDLLFNQYKALLIQYQSLLDESSKITNPFENGEILNKYDILSTKLFSAKEELIKIGNIEFNIKIRKKAINNWINHKWNNEYKPFISMLINDLELEMSALKIEIKNTFGNEKLFIRLRTLEMERNDLKRIRDDIYNLVIIRYEMDDASRYATIMVKSITELIPSIVPDIG